MTFFDELYAVTAYPHKAAKDVRAIVEKWRKRKAVNDVVSGKSTFELMVWQISIHNRMLNRFRKGVGVDQVNGSPSHYDQARRAEEELDGILPTMTSAIVNGERVFPSDITKPVYVLWPTWVRDMVLFVGGATALSWVLKGILEGDWSWTSFLSSLGFQSGFALLFLLLRVAYYPFYVTERQRAAERLLQEAKFVDAAVRLALELEEQATD